MFDIGSLFTFIFTQALLDLLAPFLALFGVIL